MRNIVVFMTYLLLLLSACNEQYTPKPRAYQRIYYPPHRYKPVEVNSLFSSEIPEYAVIFPDSSRDAEKGWFNLYFLPFKAKLHLSYKIISPEVTLQNLKEDARSLVYKHTVKADEIEENLFTTKYGNSGIFYELEGSTATAVTFYLTDSTSNFLRGALYFSTKINRDSLDPVIRFLKDDIRHFIQTLNWKNSK